MRLIRRLWPANWLRFNPLSCQAILGRVSELIAADQARQAQEAKLLARIDRLEANVAAAIEQLNQK